MFTHQQAILKEASLCRDRVGGSTENAIQLAHTDNHCAKALELELCVASQQRPPGYCTRGIPLAPTLEDVRHYNSGRRRAHARVTGDRRETYDAADAGDETVFLGKRLPQRGGMRTLEMHNAVGFFMYTTCKLNSLGTWPQKMGAAHTHRTCCM